MENKFANKYRIPSSRLQNWDYSWSAYYFVTICTYGKQHFFGSIENGVMNFSNLGKIAHDEWMKAPIVRPDMNITLFDFIIMPNHLHGIIKIGKNKYNNDHLIKGESFIADLKNKEKGDIVDDSRTDTMHCVSTSKPHGKSTSTPRRRNNFGPQKKNLGSIIRGYKSGVTKMARQIDPNFAWQARYYDSIVRDRKAYKKVSKYILNNPSNWLGDGYYIIQ